MHIIPAIDIINGRCVRLKQGDYSSVTEYGDPLEMAKMLEEHGVTRLHLVDLDGAKARKVINLNVLEAIAGGTSLEIDFGGGVQSDTDIHNVFNAGARQITAGSVAIRQPEKLESWISEYGVDKIILGADVKDGLIAIGGWEEKSSISLNEFIEQKMSLGVKYVISTDVQQDGMLNGPSTDLYASMQAAFPSLNIIASGGVSSLRDLEELKELNLYGAIVGKAIYEGKVTLKQISDFYSNH